MAARKNFWRKFFSGVTVFSLLLNSVLPYGVLTTAYAQESTASATLQSADPTPSDTPSPTPTETLDPTPTDTPNPTPTDVPTPTPTIDPEPTATPTATPEPSPTITPEPTPEATPSATPTPLQGEILDGISTESASLNQGKIPLRMAGDFLKSSKKQVRKNYVEGEVIVKFKKDKLDIKGVFGKAQAFVFEKRFSLEKRDEIKSANIQVFRSKKSTEEMVKELKSDSNVEYAEPNYIRPWSSTIPNDTNFSFQWALNNTTTPASDVSAPEAWDIYKGNNAVIVGILDSGVAYNHPDLINNMWNGSSCKDENNLNASCHIP